MCPRPQTTGDGEPSDRILEHQSDVEKRSKKLRRALIADVERAVLQALPLPCDSFLEKLPDVVLDAVVRSVLEIGVLESLATTSKTMREKTLRVRELNGWERRELKKRYEQRGTREGRQSGTGRAFSSRTRRRGARTSRKRRGGAIGRRSPRASGQNGAAQGTTRAPSRCGERSARAAPPRRAAGRASGARATSCGAARASLSHPSIPPLYPTPLSYYRARWCGPRRGS